MVLGKKFVFQFRHVHVRWALAFAALAFEAQVHDLEHFFACQRVRRQVPIDGSAQSVCPSPCRVFFFQRDHVGRTHGACQAFATLAVPVAHFNRPVESALSAAKLK